MKSILVFGDSITYGLCDQTVGGWVNRLRLYLDKLTGFDVEVFNLGRSGEVTKGTLDRFDAECQARYVPGRETKVIFAIGINDTQDIEGKDRTDIKQFEQNIRELIEKAKKITSDITFVGLTPVDELKVVNRLSKSINMFKSYFNKKIIKFDEVIQRACTDQKLLFIKVFDLLDLDDLEDGLHPNDQGHSKMFKRICHQVS